MIPSARMSQEAFKVGSLLQRDTLSVVGCQIILVNFGEHFQSGEEIIDFTIWKMTQANSLAHFAG